MGKDDADDPFAELLDLGGLGYTAAAKPAAANEKKNETNKTIEQVPLQQAVSNEDAMYAYMYGTTPQQKVAAKKQKDSARQKQKKKKLPAKKKKKKKKKKK